LAPGVAVVTVSGYVWYVPALVGLWAGADRPDSRRTAAVACLCGWVTAGAIAAVRLVAEAWWMSCATAVAGAAVPAGFRVRVTVQHRRERPLANGRRCVTVRP